MRIHLQNYSTSAQISRLLFIPLRPLRAIYIFLSQGLHSYQLPLINSYRKMEKVSALGTKICIVFFSPYIFDQRDRTEGSSTDKQRRLGTMKL